MRVRSDCIPQLVVRAVAESDTKFLAQAHDLKAQPRVEEAENGEICGGDLRQTHVSLPARCYGPDRIAFPRPTKAIWISRS